MGSRSRRSRSTGRGGSNWKRAALARSSKEKEKEEFVQRPCRFSHSTKIPEVRLLLSLSLSLPLPPAFIELLAPSLNSYHARSRNGRSSTGFFFVARPRERASNRRLLERDHHPCCGSIRQRFLTPAALHAPSDFRFQRFGVPRSITRFSSSSRLSARATFFEPTNQPRVTPPLSRRHQL